MEDISSQALPQLVQASGSINLNKIQVKDGTVGIPGLENAQKNAADDVIDDAVREMKSAQQPKIRQVTDAINAVKAAQ